MQTALSGLLEAFWPPSDHASPYRRTRPDHVPERRTRGRACAAESDEFLKAGTGGRISLGNDIFDVEYSSREATTIVLDYILIIWTPLDC